jgi:hypothetical protein
MQIAQKRTFLVVSIGLTVCAGHAVTMAPQSPPAAGRDAASVLAEMRTALGGDQLLDGIKAFTVSGHVKQQPTSQLTFTMSLDLSVLLPDYFLDVRHDNRASGPRTVDVTYYKGFRGDVLIRKTDSNIRMPPDPWPQTPAIISAREREMTVLNKQRFARLGLILFGTSFSSYPLQFTYIGAGQRDGRAIELIDGAAGDGYHMRLVIDAATHLPSAIAYRSSRGVVVSTTSLVAVRGGSVVSTTPGQTTGNVDLPNMPMEDFELAPLNFKTENGVTWPHRLLETAGGMVFTDTDLGAFRLNPKLDPKRFDVH